MVRSALLATALLGFASQAIAGGSSNSVRVLGLSIFGGTNYVLIVAPVRDPMSERLPDPYFGTCDRFEVHGTFSRLRGAWPWTATLLTRQTHIDALAYLGDAQRTGNVVELGWMGHGFVAVEKSNPCVVRSRGLRIFDDHGKTAIMSFHDVV